MAVQMEHFALIDNYIKQFCCFIFYILLCEQFIHIGNYRSVVMLSSFQLTLHDISNLC